MAKTSVEEIFEDIEAAKAVHQKWYDKSKKYIRAYNGFYDDVNSPYYDETTCINWIRRIVDAQVQNLWAVCPIVELPKIKAIDFTINNAAATLINQAIEKAKIGEQFKQAIFDATLVGTGWIKWGYSSWNPTTKAISKLNKDPLLENDNWVMAGRIEECEEGEDHSYHIEIHESLLDNQVILQQAIATHGLGSTVRLLAHIEQHRKLQQREAKRGIIDYRLKSKQIWGLRVDPREILIDPCATTIEDAEWVAHRLVRHIDDVKRDDSLSNTRDLKGGVVPKFNNSQGESNYLEKIYKVTSSKDEYQQDGMIELWDVWNRKHNCRYIVTEQCDDFLYKESPPVLELDGFFPFTQVKFCSPLASKPEEESQRAYGESVAAKVFPEQIQLNILYSTSLRLTKVSIPFMVAKGNWDEATLKNIEEAGVPGGILPSKDINATLELVSAGGNTNDILGQIAKLEAIIQFKSGWSGIQLMGTSSQKLATGQQIEANASSVIVSSLLVIVNDAFIHGACIVRDLIRKFYTNEQIINILGSDGQEMLAASPSDLMAATYSATPKLMAGSQSSIINQQRLQQASYVYNLVAQSPYVKQRELLKYMLGEAGLPRTTDFIYSDSEIMQMQQQQALMAQSEGGPVDPNQANRQAASMERGEAVEPTPPQPL